MVWEDQHHVFEKGGFYFGNERMAERLSQIHAVDSRSYMWAELFNVHRRFL